MNKYYDGITGELLTEEAVIGSNVKTISIGDNNYDIMRTLLYIVNPDNFANNTNMGDNGFMCFYTDEEYERTKAMLKKLGHSFKDETLNNNKVTEKDLAPDVKSPYPSNSSIFNHIL